MPLPSMVLVCALALLSGCTANGRLDPRVAPIVGGIDLAICESLPIFVTSTSVNVGEACMGVAGEIQKILSAFSAPAGAPTGALPRVSVTLRGVVVAKVRRDLARHVQEGLDARVASGAL